MFVGVREAWRARLCGRGDGEAAFYKASVERAIEARSADGA
jgi:hypothetical protein